MPGQKKSVTAWRIKYGPWKWVKLLIYAPPYKKDLFRISFKKLTKSGNFIHKRHLTTEIRHFGKKKIFFCFYMNYMFSQTLFVPKHHWIFVQKNVNRELSKWWNWLHNLVRSGLTTTTERASWFSCVKAACEPSNLDMHDPWLSQIWPISHGLLVPEENHRRTLEMLDGVITLCKIGWRTKGLM